MISAFLVVLLACGFAIGTLVAGWWAVPVVGLVAGFLLSSARRPLLVVPVAAGLAWAALLLRSALAPDFPALATRFEGLLSTGRPMLVAATLLFPVVTAWAAVLVATALAGTRPGQPKE